MNHPHPLEEVRKHIGENNPISDSIMNYLLNYSKILAKTNTDDEIKWDAEGYLQNPDDQKLEGIGKRVTEALRMIWIEMESRKNLYNTMKIVWNNLSSMQDVHNSTIKIGGETIQIWRWDEDNVAGETIFTYSNEKAQKNAEKTNADEVKITGVNNDRTFEEVGNLMVNISWVNNDLTIKLLKWKLSGKVTGVNNSITIRVVWEDAEIAVDNIWQNNKIEIETDLRKRKESSNKQTWQNETHRQTVYNFTSNWSPEWPIWKGIDSREVQWLWIVSTHIDPKGIRVVFKDSDFLIEKNEGIKWKFLNNVLGQWENGWKLVCGEWECYSTDDYVRIKYQGNKFFIDKITWKITDQEPESKNPEKSKSYTKNNVNIGKDSKGNIVLQNISGKEINL